eukprot:m51a1_g3606 hypothetical protein (349) ;mRNA; f:34331-35624
MLVHSPSSRRMNTALRAQLERPGFALAEALVASDAGAAEPVVQYFRERCREAQLLRAVVAHEVRTRAASSGPLRSRSAATRLYAELCRRADVAAYARRVTDAVADAARADPRGPTPRSLESAVAILAADLRRVLREAGESAAKVQGHLRYAVVGMLYLFRLVVPALLAAERPAQDAGAEVPGSIPPGGNSSSDPRLMLLARALQWCASGTQGGEPDTALTVPEGYEAFAAAARDLRPRVRALLQGLVEFEDDVALVRAEKERGEEHAEALGRVRERLVASLPAVLEALDKAGEGDVADALRAAAPASALRGHQQGQQGQQGQQHGKKQWSPLALAAAALASLSAACSS